MREGATSAGWGEGEEGALALVAADELAGGANGKELVEALLEPPNRELQKPEGGSAGCNGTFGGGSKSSAGGAARGAVASKGGAEGDIGANASSSSRGGADAEATRSTGKEEAETVGIGFCRVPFKWATMRFANKSDGNTSQAMKVKAEPAR